MNADEPELAVCSPVAEPPEHMSDEAKAEWYRMLGPLTAARVVTDGDIAMFASYCDYWAEYCFYAKKLRAEGPYAVVQKKDREGKPIAGAIYTEWNPARTMRDAAWDRYTKAASELGLTPSARSRVAKDTNPNSLRTAADIRASLRA
jgi:P27 family predicted phage terminase small subunit